MTFEIKARLRTEYVTVTLSGEAVMESAVVRRCVIAGTGWVCFVVCGVQGSVKYSHSYISLATTVRPFRE